MERRVVIIGAGTSGLLACKYVVEKGFNPVVFEADESIGGIWNHTIESTRLQNMRETYKFSDMDWPAFVTEIYPSNKQVLEYVMSYAEKFGLFPYIRLNSRVIGIDYVGESLQEMGAWDRWGGTGVAFGSKGKWHVAVENTKTNTAEVHQAEFVVLCIGRFSGIANIPELPPNQDSKVFDGVALHSMDYSAMDNSAAAKLIKRKRITIIGSGKSAADIATECARANGKEYPCTIIVRTPHWFLTGDCCLWGVSFGLLYFNRFAELLFHKPDESFLHHILATLLSPLRWGISKFAETSLRWKLPLRKYGMIPKQSFTEDISSCQIGVLPDDFFEKVEEGSIILKKSQKFGFSREGVKIEGDDKPIASDLVILATGYKGDLKLKQIFISPVFQHCFDRTPESGIHLYRQIIHPRIPQLAIVGYAEGLSNLAISEIRCRWLSHFLDGKFSLPRVRDMEQGALMWKRYMKLYGGRNFWRSCIGTANIWYNDQLCIDMGINPRRKKGFFVEWFQPYGPMDYAGLGSM